MTLLELITAGALLGVILTTCLQMTGAAAGQRRAVRQRQAADLELANVLERLAARPWSELTPERAARERLSPAAAALLPEAELHAAVAAVPGMPAGEAHHRLAPLARRQRRAAAGGQLECLAVSAGRRGRRCAKRETPSQTPASR